MAFGYSDGDDEDLDDIFELISDLPSGAYIPNLRPATGFESSSGQDASARYYPGAIPGRNVGHEKERPYIPAQSYCETEPDGSQVCIDIPAVPAGWNDLCRYFAKKGSIAPIYNYPYRPPNGGGGGHTVESEVSPNYNGSLGAGYVFNGYIRFAIWQSSRTITDIDLMSISGDYNSYSLGSVQYQGIESGKRIWRRAISVNMSAVAQVTNGFGIGSQSCTFHFRARASSGKWSNDPDNFFNTTTANNFNFTHRVTPDSGGGPID